MEPDRRRFLRLAGGGALLAIAGGAAIRSRVDDPSGPTAAVGDAPPPPAPALGATVSTLAPLPLPDAPPSDPNAPTPALVLGTIAIPRIALDAPVQEGITLTAINRGPGHWPGTALPGALGNVVIAGHRTTYTHPFNRLNELQPGDGVVLTTNQGSFPYAVRGTVIVPVEAVDIAAQSYAHTATLFACHPPGSADQRIVVKLRLLDAAGSPVDDEASLPPLDAGSQPGPHTLLMRTPDPLGNHAG